MLVDEDSKILLGKRNRQPDKGKLNLPGGFVDPDETLEQAIARELKEELGLSASDYGPLTYAGSRVIYHTEDGKERQLVSVIMVGHMPHRDFDANDEVDEYVWKHPLGAHARRTYE
jgi:NAD+ diphosphatase